MTRGTRGWVAVAAAAIVMLPARFCLVAQEAPPVAPPAFAERVVKALGAIQNVWGPIVLSSDGDRLAYQSYKSVAGKSEYRLVVDGNPGPLLGGVSIGSARFSPDGKRFACFIYKGGTCYLLIDGQERTPVGGPFAFSPDGRHFAYIGADSTGSIRLLRDGVPEPNSSQTPECFVFSPDSRRLAFRAGWTTTRYVVVDGRKGPIHESVGDLVFSPDSTWLAYVLCEKGKWGVMCGGAAYGGYDEVGKLFFSPDGGRLTHRARLGNKWFIVCNKVKGAAFDDVRDPVFPLLGGRMAYAATDRKDWFIVCDGKKGQGCSEVGEPVFSTDGKRLAYRTVRDGKTLLVCDSMESPVDGGVTWIGLSPDGRHLAAVGGGVTGRRMAVDGTAGPEHAQVLVPEHFDDVAGKLRYIVVDRGEASLVEVDWPEGRTWEDAFRPPAK